MVGLLSPLTASVRSSSMVFLEGPLEAVCGGENAPLWFDVSKPMAVVRRVKHDGRLGQLGGRAVHALLSVEST